MHPAVMTAAPAMIAAAWKPVRRPDRSGFSLLEVLVASGILVVGLASVAALLPAAGSRLAEATAIDRSGTLSANAYADMMNRSMLSAALFSGVPNGRTVVFGLGVTGVTHASVQPANPTELAKRVDVSADNSFHVEDDLAYRSGAGGMPVNIFETVGTVTFREFRRGICYGAMLAPEPFGQPVGSGSSARLSIAIFKKPPPALKSISLARTSSAASVFHLPLSNLTNIAANPIAVRVGHEADQKKFLKGCSWVLAVSTDPSQPPRWFRIGSSWTTTIVNASTGTHEPGQSFVSFESQDVETFKPTAGNLAVWGFDGLIRVDEQFVVLE